MNHFPLHAHGEVNVIKILKQIQNDPTKVLQKIREADSLDISYVPYQLSNGWALIDVEKFKINRSAENSRILSKIFTSQDSFLDLLISLESEKLIIITDPAHIDKILTVINKSYMVKSRTIHAHLFLLLIDLEIRLRSFYGYDEETLIQQMRSLHPGKSSEIDSKTAKGFTGESHSSFVEQIAVHFLAEIYVKYNHSELGRQREQVKAYIYDLRTSLVHTNATNIAKIDVTGNVIDTVRIITNILTHLSSAGY